MPGRHPPHFRTNDHQFERAFSAPTPTGDSFSTMTSDTVIKMSNMNKRDLNGGSNALLLGHQSPCDDRRRGLGNEYVSDATLLTTASTVGIISETKRATNHTKGEHPYTPTQKKRRRVPIAPQPNDLSTCRLTFMVVGALVFVFAVIFGTMYLIIYRMKLMQ